jgi:hypothetical protein
MLDGLGADPLPAAVRALLVFAGILTLPGIPIVVALRIPGRALAGILIPAISLSVTVLLTQTTIVADWWSPLRSQAILTAGSLAACIWARRTLPAHTRTGSFGFDRAHWTRRRAVELSALAASLGCFGLAVADLDVADTGRFGVIPALVPVYFLGLGLLAAVGDDDLVRGGRRHRNDAAPITTPRTTGRLRDPRVHIGLDGNTQGGSPGSRPVAASGT